MNKNFFTIDENDEMFLYSRDLGLPENQLRAIYFSMGYLIWQQLKAVLETFNKDISSVDSLLDFASGYGRVTRFIAEEMPPKNIWVSDIYPNAVDFLVDNFGVNGVVSSKKPEDVKLEGNYSVITCISLFSHLPKDLFIIWLDYLVNLLKDDGLLIFTTHSLGVMGKFGMKFKYRKVSESRSLDTDIYGTSYVSRAFVEKTVKRRYRDKKVVCYAPKYLAGKQDLYVIGNASREYREVNWPGLMSANIEDLTRDGNNLIVSGWAYSESSRETASEMRAFSTTTEYRCDTTYGKTRKDVAEHFGDAAATASGFTSTITLPDNYGPEVILEFRSQSGIKGARILQAQGLEDPRNTATI